jgi:hypothetical protein
MILPIPRALACILAIVACAVSAPISTVEVHAQEQPRATASNITFSSITHDFGGVLDANTYVTTFPFMNTGDGMLTIQEVKASCGCTTPALVKKVFNPGEASQIEVSFKPKGSGRQAKRITVFSNDPEEPIVILTIEADVTQFLPTEPSLVRFDGIMTGEAAQEELTLIPLDPDATIDRVYVSGLAARYFSAGIVPTADGKRGSSRRININLLPETPWGSHYATLNIVATGRPTPGADPVTHTGKVTISAKVIGTLQADSTMFRVGIVRPGETFTTIIRLTRPDGNPFQVLSTTLSGSTVPDMAVKAIPIASENGGGYSIVLTGTPARTEQSIRGYVKIYTDVPGETELELRVGGIARDTR